MSLSYETAVKLRDAGFPQNHDYSYSYETDFCFKCDRGVCFPTLSELIEACGDGFDSLGKRPDGWCALSFNPTPNFMGFETLSPSIRVVGVTPEETVASLWLALNKK